MYIHTCSSLPDDLQHEVRQYLMLVLQQIEVSLHSENADVHVVCIQIYSKIHNA